MALGIKDVTRKAPIVGGRAEAIVALTFDTDYLAGGYAITAAELGFDTIEHMSINIVAGFVPFYDPGTGKVLVMYGNYDASDGPLIEVVDGLNAIDGLVARARVVGAAS